MCVKIVPRELDDTLDVVYERGRGMMADSKIFGLNKWRDKADTR